MKARFPGRVDYSRDPRPRPTTIHHCCTRYDYLPEIMEHYRLPTLVLDADVMHRRALRLPDAFDVAYARWYALSPEQVEQYSESLGQPFVWVVLGMWVIAGAVLVAPTEAGFEFARRCQWFIDNLESFRLKGTLFADQVAVLAALRDVDPARVHRLNRDGCEHVCWDPAHQDHAIWLPPHPSVELDSEWRRVAATYASGPSDGRFDF